MKVLVVGGGGREHVLAWKLAQSPLATQVIAAPGNPGISGVGSVTGGKPDVRGIVALAQSEAADLVVVGPEAPLTEGLADMLREKGIRCFGPGAAAARLEGSKAFAKDFMFRHGVPTADSRSFTSLAPALEYLNGLADVPVIKKSGLAAGKGVTVAGTMAEAEAALREAFIDDDGSGVVIEERLTGEELSLLLITDGKVARPLLLAQDYKQLGDGDTGPMTGGMGAVAPADLLSDAQWEDVRMQVIDRSLAGLQADGLEFHGVLFIGLMLTRDGVKVLEYNVRFGDPEAQSVLPLMQSDLLQLLLDTVSGRLEQSEITWSGQVAVGVVMAAPGYPGNPESGIPLELPPSAAGVHLFHAGTAFSGDRLVSAGGRVLNVVAVADDEATAREQAYRAVRDIGFEGAIYRSDIGMRRPAGRQDIVTQDQLEVME